MKRDDRGVGDLSPEAPRGGVPLFGTWRRAYALAIALFATEIALLYAFTRYFS